MKDFSASFLPLLYKICHFPATNFALTRNIFLGPVLSYLAENSAILLQCLKERISATPIISDFLRQMTGCQQLP
jgi:hypothetical protein